MRKVQSIKIDAVKNKDITEQKGSTVITIGVFMINNSDRSESLWETISVMSHCKQAILFFSFKRENDHHQTDCNYFQTI